MSDNELERIASGVLARTRARLPAPLRALARQVPVHCEDYVDDELVEQGYDPDLLGLFVGPPLGEEGHQTNPVPAQIILYLESIFDYVDGDLNAFRREVRTTYLHELGHFLGWDEDEVAARGLQ
jgi:predicted Zn-dependent protease with MMP-like domain